MKPSLVVIGLGNPGASYERTRHNVGFQAVDSLSKEFGEGEWQGKQKFSALIREGRIVTVPVLFVKPQTFMNLSGDSVRKLVDFYKIDPANQILVFCDDIDIPLGELRLRKQGGPGTHNGLKSLIDIFGEGFPRLRIGLGAQPSGSDLSSWILSVLTQEETEVLQKSFEDLPQVLKDFVLDEVSH